MASTSRITAYEHLISLRKFDTSAERMMNRVYAMVGESRKNLSIPIMIGINVDYNGHDEALPVLRNFLHRLRRLHQKHFVRFVTDTLWAMESDNGHLFYTHDGPKESRSDIIWTVKVLGDEQVEVWVSNTHNLDRLALLTNTSIKLKKFVSSHDIGDNDEDLCHLMHRFYARLPELQYVKLMDEDFHVMLVPSSNNKGYCSLPLYGMSYFDAERKYKAILNQMEYTERCYYDTLPDKTSIGDIFFETMKLMQENKSFGVARKTAQDTYCLAEQLFAIFAGYQMTRRSAHDVILFQEREHNTNYIVDTYRSSMTNIEDNLTSR